MFCDPFSVAIMLAIGLQALIVSACVELQYPYDHGTGGCAGGGLSYLKSISWLKFFMWTEMG